VTKGRKQADKPRPVTLYYCCGGYVAKGNAVCPRVLVGKAALEGGVIDAARKHLDEMVSAKGAAIRNGMRSAGIDPAQADSIIGWARRAISMLAGPIDPGPAQRILRAIIEQIVFDPGTSACRIAFRAIPDLETDPTIAA
jgi:hypothetical protein